MKHSNALKTLFQFYIGIDLDIDRCIFHYKDINMRMCVCIGALHHIKKHISN